jgi:hypothetical protein
MWYKSAQKYDKQKPDYELKIIGWDAENAIRKLLYLQSNYNPSDVELRNKIKKLISHLEEKYGSSANVRLFAEGDTLEGIIWKNVNELFGKVYNKK